MHHFLALFWFIYFHYLLGAFIGATLFLLVFALFGIETGVHKKYVDCLLAIFELCRQTIEKKRTVGVSDEDDESTLNHEGHSGGDTVAGNDEEWTEVRPQRILSISESSEEPRDFQLSDIFDFIQKGVQVMVDDEVTKRFNAEELRSWNLLTRTNKNYQFTSWRIALVWAAGFIFRFYMMFPVRLAIFMMGMLFLLAATSLIGLMSDGPAKRWLYKKASVTAFRILSRSVSAVINHHNEEFKPKCGGICVANHTSPFDVVMLHTGGAYSLVGQVHSGYLGLMERVLSSSTSHIFFERFEATDRSAVTKKMHDHISDINKLPILIFPEGTCINNSAVMMFKKGSFEVASTVYPAAIKYNPIFGDPFWDSSRYGYFTYLLRMMTSWAIVCDIWYLPPMTRKSDESAAEFANRVKSAIATQGGLVDLEWDGQLKRDTPRPELKEKVQMNFSRKISVRHPGPPPVEHLDLPSKEQEDKSKTQ